MKSPTMKSRPLAVALALAAVALAAVPRGAAAHCDTLDGPVVKTARAALDAKDVRPVLAWVSAAREGEIRAAFREALAARVEGPSRDGSDRKFLEAVVRVHREGEGAPYTGLAPAGSRLPDAVRLADEAIVARDAAAVEARLVEQVRAGVRARFARLAPLQPPGDDVAAGRAWVAAYVDWIHHVEAVDGISLARATGPGDGASHDHGAEPSTMAVGEGHSHAHAR